MSDTKDDKRRNLFQHEISHQIEAERQYRKEESSKEKPSLLMTIFTILIALSVIVGLIQILFSL